MTGELSHLSPTVEPSVNNSSFNHQLNEHFNTALQSLCKITLTNKQKFISFSQNQCWNQFEHWLCLKGLIGNLGKLHHVNACALIEQFHQLGCDCCPFIYLLSLQLPFCRGMGFVRLQGGTLSSFYALLCRADLMGGATGSEWPAGTGQPSLNPTGIRQNPGGHFWLCPNTFRATKNKSKWEKQKMNARERDQWKCLHRS